MQKHIRLCIEQKEKIVPRKLQGLSFPHPPGEDCGKNVDEPHYRELHSLFTNPYHGTVPYAFSSCSPCAEFLAWEIRTQVGAFPEVHDNWPIRFFQDRLRPLRPRLTA